MPPPKSPKNRRELRGRPWWCYSTISTGLLCICVAAFLVGNFYLVYVVAGKLWARFGAADEHRPAITPYRHSTTRISSHITTISRDASTSASSELNEGELESARLGSARWPDQHRIGVKEEFARPRVELTTSRMAENGREVIRVYVKDGSVHPDGDRASAFPTVISLPSTPPLPAVGSNHNPMDNSHQLSNDDSSRSDFTIPRIRVTSVDVIRQRKPDDLAQHGRRAESTTTAARPASRKSHPARPHNGLSSTSVTLVTALLDIGRERWHHYGRLFSTYQNFMEHVLRLRLPAVIYVDERSVEFVRRVREDAGLGDYTRIVQVGLEQLPLYTYHQDIERLMDYELNGGGWRPEWDESLKSHPESCQMKYDVLVNSKPYFLYNASMMDPFSTAYFTWLDAGYGHGHREHFPPRYHWAPVLPPGRISLIKVTPVWDKLSRYSLAELYRRNVAVLSGGFLGGDKSTLAQLHYRYYWRVVELLQRERVVDDDQTVLVVLANDRPEMFNLVEGGWFDAFRLF